jgi:hypothetical protein
MEADHPPGGRDLYVDEAQGDAIRDSFSASLGSCATANGRYMLCQLVLPSTDLMMQSEA